MLKGYLIKILIKLIGKNLDDFKEIGFVDNFKIRDDVYSQFPDYVEILKREKIILQLNAGEIGLSDIEKSFVWGRQYQVKSEIEELEKARNKYNEAMNYDPKKSNIKEIYEQMSKRLKSIIKK